MRTPLTAALFAAFLPYVPAAALAAERGQIVNDAYPGGRTVNLNTGDTVTYAGVGAAIVAAQPGNMIQGSGIRLTAGSDRHGNTIGLLAHLGGSAVLQDSSIITLGGGQGAHALVVLGSPILAGLGGGIALYGGTVQTRGESSYGAFGENGGRITLLNTSVTTTGMNSAALWATGVRANDGIRTVIAGTNLTISTQSSNSPGVYAGAGAEAILTGGSIFTAYNSPGVSANGDGSRIVLNRTDVRAADGMAARLAGGKLEVNGGSLTGASAVLLDAPTLASTRTPAFASIRNATLVATGPHGYGLDINAPGTSAILDNVSIKALGSQGGGIWLPSAGTGLSANTFDITSSQTGVDNRGGQAVLTNGSITTLGAQAHGLYASREAGQQAVIRATQVDIETRGDRASGVVVRLSGADVTLQNVRITTGGRAAHGLRAAEAGARLSARDTFVSATGPDAAGLLAANGATIALDHSHLDVHGRGAPGIWSYQRDPALYNIITISNNSQVSTQDGVGLLAAGGDHAFHISDSHLSARSGGNADQGILLRSVRLASSISGAATDTDSGRISLDASQSLLIGDVRADNGAIDISLTRGTILIGAVTPGDSGRVDTLGLDASSTWLARGSSSVGTLANAGVIAFSPPASGGGFKTLTVKHYQGGGLLVLGSRLRGAGSGSDRLIIDGGTATGVTSLRILNRDSAAGSPRTSVPLVQTINGGSASPDAFSLDPGSTGYRASTGTLALYGYDYSLFRVDSGDSPQWFLAAEDIPAEPLDPAVTSSGKPGWPLRPVKLPFQNVAPEGGAYLGNRLASSRFFTHGLHDRMALAAQDDALQDGTARNGLQRRVWGRVEGRQDAGLHLAQGRVDISTDSAIMQLGGDLITAALGRDGAVYAGLMAGYGSARTRADATLVRSGGATAQARANGTVSGYSVGLYGTAYQNGATRLGAYADSWLQYGRYANQITSELGSARYHANLLSASIEAGYAVAPFAPGSTLGPVVLEPHAQLIYSRYAAQDAALQGTYTRSGNNNAWNSRIGVRLYPQATANAPAVRPFLEADWLHQFGNPSVQMGPNTLDAALSRNSLELKLGAQGQVTRAVLVSGHVFGQAGNNNQRGYGGMLNLGYRW